MQAPTLAPNLAALSVTCNLDSWKSLLPGAPGLAGFETWDCRRHKCGVRSITARRNGQLNPAAMPWGLERWHGGHDLHSIPFSCYNRQPLLATAQRRDLFLEVLELVRRRYSWVVLAYVVIPEHVHLLVSEPLERPLPTGIQALKLGCARRLIGERRRGAELIECGPQRIWQARYYDFNVCTADKRVEKLHYIHRNPVKRGLVEVPELWHWSSFRAYAYQEKGPVGINQWSEPKLKTIAPTSLPK